MHMHNVVLANKTECTGCSLCQSLCKSKAIKMTEDVLGFCYPEVESDKCIGCMACVESCPVINKRSSSDREAVCIAAMAEDNIRQVSSSGGIFSVIAEQVIKTGGSVLGVFMDDSLRAVFGKATSLEELAGFRGAKYIQADVEKVYEYLSAKDNDETMLVTGTPCQIAAVKKYITKNTINNVLTIDLVCHGVMSQRMLGECISNKYAGNNIKSIQFRDKRNGWTSNILTLKDDCENEIREMYSGSLFEHCYHDSIALRECCYECPFSELPRQGDITLGDFLGIGNYSSEMDDGLGTSLILVNSDKGYHLFDEIKSKLQRYVEVPVDIAKQNNRIDNQIQIPEARKRLERLTGRLGLYDAMKVCEANHYDICLVGCWTVENYGSNLCYYALYRVLKKKGFEVLMAERPQSSIWKPNASAGGFNVNPYDAGDSCDLFMSRYDMHELNSMCDTFILGSDQLFYHDLYRQFDHVQNLDFVYHDKRKVAYGASIGRTSFEGTEEEKQELAYWLSDYDAISVREQSGVEVFNREFGVDCTAVLDPVFLLTKEDYDSIADKGNSLCDAPYIATYVLDSSFEKRKIINSVRMLKNIQIVSFSDVINQMKTSEKKEGTVNNETWLRGIRDADFVIADSFHGMCLAIIFRKDFLCLINDRRGPERFYSLANELGLQDRLVKNGDVVGSDLINASIDYDKVYERLTEQIAESENWLLSAISQEITSRNKDVICSHLDLLKVEATASLAKEKAIANEQWIGSLDKRLGALEERIAFMDKRLGAMEISDVDLSKKFGVSEKRIASVDKRLGASEERIASVDKRLGMEEKELVAAEKRIAIQEQVLDKNQVHLGKVEEIAADINVRLVANELRVASMDERLGTVEKTNAEHMRIMEN